MCRPHHVLLLTTQERTNQGSGRTQQILSLQTEDSRLVTLTWNVKEGPGVREARVLGPAWRETRIYRCWGADAWGWREEGGGRGEEAVEARVLGRSTQSRIQPGKQESLQVLHPGKG